MPGSRNACGKLAFRTKKEAKYSRRRVPHAKGRKIYLCPNCGFYHLTSMTLSEQTRRGLRDREPTQAEFEREQEGNTLGEPT